MKVISLNDYIQIAKNETMIEIWLSCEVDRLSAYLVYGFDGKSYYSLVDDWWEPIYRYNYEDFCEYVKSCNVFYNETMLVKLK